MSLRLNWGALDEAFCEQTRRAIEDALNDVHPRPSSICAPLEVKDFDLGSTPPLIAILEVAALAADRVCVVLEIKYRGNAYLVLNTKVQANPVSGANAGFEALAAAASSHHKGGTLVAHRPLIVPMQLSLSDIVLDGVLRLHYAAAPAPALHASFLNDPLVGIAVSSTFDSAPKLRAYLQSEIEDAARHVLRKLLPKFIYDWFQARGGASASPPPP